jgi:predicted unusual protein kinase regulating ubiquinone biosynthesis (AarF/ABC1/UbiB family)
MISENFETNNSLTVKKLVDALPEDIADPGGIANPLQDLLAGLEHKKVPTRSLMRMWILSSLQAKVAIGYLAYGLRKNFAPASEQEKMLNETHTRAALKILSTMGYMRGAVMKIGQLLAGLPTLMPDQVADVLAALHFEAPPMHYGLIHETLLNELGREPEEIFASFDRKAFAAASLGQVHRARLKSGEEVAVKIQYPNIAKTISADLRNLRTVMQPMRLSAEWQSLRDNIEEVEAMLNIETDYRHEAQSCREAAPYFAGDENIKIPKIFKDYSTSKVLTMEYLPGVHLKDYMAGNPSQRERDHYTDLISILSSRLYFRARTFFADPNPGNFIFMEDGRLGLIDFGCMRKISDQEWAMQMEAWRSGLNNDQEALDKAIASHCLFDSPSAMEDERLKILRAHLKWQLKPCMYDGLFDFSDENFFREGLELHMQLFRKRFTRGAPINIWSSRFIFGFRALAYNLKGKSNLKRIIEHEARDLPELVVNN